MIEDWVCTGFLPPGEFFSGQSHLEPQLVLSSSYCAKRLEASFDVIYHRTKKDLLFDF